MTNYICKNNPQQIIKIECNKQISPKCLKVYEGMKSQQYSTFVGKQCRYCYNYYVYLVNKDKQTNYLKKYCIDNAETIKQYQQQYAINNKDKLKQYQQQYKINKSTTKPKPNKTVEIQSIITKVNNRLQKLNTLLLKIQT